MKLKILCVILCFLSAGCGKKVTQKTSEESKRTPALSTSSVELSNSGSHPSLYTFPDLAEVYIPKKLVFMGGDPASQTKVFFSRGIPKQEMFCLYGHKMGSDYSLINCYSEGGVSNYRGGDKVIQDQYHQVKIENSPAKVGFEMEIDWH